jgi:hypothetical protein
MVAGGVGLFLTPGATGPAPVGLDSTGNSVMQVRGDEVAPALRARKMLGCLWCTHYPVLHSTGTKDMLVPLQMPWTFTGWPEVSFQSGRVGG